MPNTQSLPITVATKVNKMEREYFFRRCNEEASARTTSPATRGERFVQFQKRIMFQAKHYALLSTSYRIVWNDFCKKVRA